MDEKQLIQIACGQTGLLILFWGSDLQSYACLSSMKVSMQCLLSDGPLVCRFFQDRQQAIHCRLCE